MNEKDLIFAVAITLLISLNRHFLTAIFNDKQRSSYFSNIPGCALFNHILSTHYVENSFICGNLCLRNKQCLSFNFGTIPLSDATFSCQLSSSSAKRSPVNLRKRSEFDYFELLVSQNKLLTLSSSFLSIMHGSILRVTIPPPGIPPGICNFVLTWRSIPHPRARKKRQFPTPGTAHRPQICCFVYKT